MEKTLSGMVLLVFGASILFACNEPAKPAVETHPLTDTTIALVEKILTAGDQAKLTPDSVLQLLKQGNQRFASDSLTKRNHTERIREAVLGQYPKAMILSCIDSRVPVEDVFDRGIGDVFVARVAGNIVNEDILGSMEYGCKVSGAKLILVLGHEYCGAIKSAIDKVKLGNITAMLSKISPAVASLDHFQGQRTSRNPDFVHAVCEQNITLAIKVIRDRSEILRQMEQKGEIKIVGAMYNMETGKVDFE